MARTKSGGYLAPKLIAVAVASCFASPPAWGNPTGAQVVNGTVGFARPNASTLKVTNSPGAIINWQGFSIGAGEITRFIQQSSSSAVLNRVVGADISTIQGQLLSNGRVFLINPSGILIGAGAVIDTAGFVGSTLAMQDADFLAGKLKFAGDAQSGRIVNHGWIHTAHGGQVMLVAPEIENSGLIHTPRGELILAAGRKLTISSLDHEGVQFEVQAPTDSVVNVGKLLAEGGAIGAFAGTLKHSGEIRATSLAVDATGQIVLKAQKDIDIAAGSITSASGVTGGKVQIQSGDTTLVAGSIQARGDDGKGGTIHILGDKVGLIDRARVDASGETGGGTVLVGGDFQGRNPAIQNAFRTYVGSDAVIKADAVTNGDGGKVIVWSEDATRFYGNISARGGATGGNGGFAEVSGKNYLDYRGYADLGSQGGATGVLYLDPNNVEIRTDVASGGGTFDGGTPNIFGGGNTTSQILWSTIKTNLAAADVHITTSGTGAAAGNVTVVHNSPDLATSQDLRLLAHNNVNINGSITNTGSGRIEVYAGWNEATGTVNPLVISGTGTININQNVLTKADELNFTAGKDISIANGVTIENAPATGGSVVNIHAMGGSITANAGGATTNIKSLSADEGAFTNNASVTFFADGAITLNKTFVNVVGRGDSNVTVATLTGGSVTLNDTSLTATAGNSPDGGGTAAVTVTATTGGITLNSSTISATGADDGGSGAAGFAAITLHAANGIAVSNSTINAAAGGGGGSAATASVSLEADAGNITASSSTISATGSGVTDGTASVTLQATTGSVSVNSTSTISATGGDEASATVTLQGGSITVNASTISATGGLDTDAAGGAAIVQLLAQDYLGITNSTISANAGSAFSGGNATVTLQGLTDGISINNTNITATGGNGSGGVGGAANVILTGAGITLNSSTVAATGGDGNALTGGAATVTMTATDGGNINLGGNVTAAGGNDTNDGAATLDIIAEQGAILQSTGGVLQVTPGDNNSRAIDLQARDGIGTTGAPIRVAGGFTSLNANNAQLWGPGIGEIVLAQTTGNVDLSLYTVINGATNGGVDIKAEVGSINLPVGPGFSNPNGSITFRANSMDIQGTVTAAGGTGAINVQPVTPARPIELGTVGDINPVLALSNAELAKFSAGSLTIGSTAGGSLTVTAPITLPVATFLRGSTISQDPLATITSTNGLDVAAAGAVILTEPLNSITTFSSAGASLSLATSGSLNIATPIAFSGSVTLTTGGAITGSTGGTDVTAGSLTLSAGTGIGTSADPLATATGTLNANAGTGAVNLANTGNLSLTNVTAPGGADITATGNITVNGPINTGVSAAQLGNPLGNRIVFPVSTTITASSLVLNSSDTRFTGGTVTLNTPVQASEVRVAGAATVHLNGATSEFESIAGAGNIAIGGGTLNVGVANLDMTYSGDISGTGSLTKLGSGNLTLSGQNTYTGATTVSAGNLTLEGGAAIANTAAVNLAGPVTGLVLGESERIGSLSGGTGATVDLGSHTLTVGSAADSSFAGAMNGTGGLTKLGSGNLTLSGANTYTGATRVNAGTLVLDGGAAIANTGAVDLAAAGAALTLGASETIGSFSGVAGSTVALGGNTLTVGGAANTSFSGVINGTGGLTKQGAGMLTLSGANTYTGATMVHAGTLALGASNVIADGSSMVVNGGTLDVGAFNDTVARLQLVSGSVAGTTGVLTSASTYDMQAGTVGANLGGAVGLNKTGAGTLTLSGANTYTGATRVNAGTLVLNGGDAIANTGAVRLAAAGVSGLVLGANERIGSFSGGAGATVALGSHTLTVGGAGNFAGAIGGTGGLTKLGGGTLMLSGANTYTGATRVNAGTLSTLGGAAIADSSAVVMNGGTLSLITDETIGSLTGAAGTTVALGANTLTVGNALNTNFAGVMSGTTGGLTKQGAGTLTLSGGNTYTYTGATTVGAGTLVLAGVTLNGNLVNQSTTTVSNSSLVRGGVQHSGTLNLNDVLTVGTEFDWQGGTLTGGGTLAISGSAAFKVTGAAAHILKGPTISVTNLDLTGGSLNLQAGTVKASGTITVGSGTTLASQGATIDAPGATLDLSGTFQSGAGSVTVGSMNVLAGGLLKGTGTLNADVNNSAGTVSPGLSPGILTINGDYLQGAHGTLNMEIGGTIPGASGHDQLVVTGTATLGGSLNTSLINGFIPTAADSFTLLKANSVTGTFATTYVPPGTFLAPGYLVSSFVLSTPPSIPTVTTVPPVPPVVEVETEKLLKTLEEGLKEPQKPGPTGPLCL